MSGATGPFPFLPDDFLGFLLKKGDDSLMLWVQSQKVEPAFEGSAGETAVQSLRALAPSLHGPKLADAASQLERYGYRLMGLRRFNFKSGELFQDACVLASMASETGARNRQLAAVHGGTSPPLDHEDWTEWERVTRQRNAACKGARVLGMASLEAFLNEVLSQRFPDAYGELEERQRAAPFRKLRALCEALEISLDQPWTACIEDNLAPRRQIVHHRPGFVDDEGDARSVEPSEAVDPEAVADFLACIQDFFVAVFSAYGVAVPPTHLPPGQS